MDEIALAATLGGSAVALAGVGLTWRNGAKEREHQRSLVKEARMYEGRAKTYVDLLTTLRRIVREMEGANPIAAAEMQPVAREHHRIAEVTTPEERNKRWITHREERFSLEARLAAFGSSPVRETAAEFFAAEESFSVFWVDPEAVDELDEAVADAQKALSNVEALARDELGSS